MRNAVSGMSEDVQKNLEKDLKKEIDAVKDTKYERYEEYRKKQAAMMKKVWAERKANLPESKKVTKHRRENKKFTQWTPEEDSVLRESYKTTRRISTIAKNLGRTLDAVYARARVIGVQRQQHKHQKCNTSGRQEWSEQESEVMRNVYSRLGAESVARLLKRSVISVYARAKRMGLQSSPRFKGTLSEAGRQSISESQKARWQKYREDHGKFTIKSKIALHEQPMLRQKAVVPLTREEQGKKLLNGVKQEKQKKVEFPDFKTGASIELVKSVFKLFTLGDRERKLTYNNDAYTLGIEGVAVWNVFCADVLMKGEQVCAALNVPNTLKLEYGKVTELVYRKV
jgi:hypothetical protein